MKTLLFDIRTEAQTPQLQALSVGTGVFIGCLPIYGLHLGACILINRLFRLNLLKMYLATNINNPFSAPFFVYAEIQIGSLVRRGGFYEHTMETARNLVLGDFFADIVVGAAAVGTVLGIVFALLTYLAVCRINRNPAMAELVERTSKRYLQVGLWQWEITRAQLRFDPFYRRVISDGVLPQSGSFLHLGCGRGLLLTFLDTASQGGRVGSLELRGIDTKPGKIRIARRVLGGRARVECRDIGGLETESFDVVVSLDRFKSIGPKHRERALKDAAGRVAPGGLLIVRASTAQPWTEMWPFVGLTGSRVTSILKENEWEFDSYVLYQSLRCVVIVAKRKAAEQANE